MQFTYFLEQALKDLEIITDNKIDLKILSKFMFSDKNFKYGFEKFVFPKVKEKITEFFEENKEQKKNFCNCTFAF